MTPQGNTITLSAIGLDAPGLVSRITQRIFELEGNIVDVEEHCRRGLFAIYLQIDFSNSVHPLKEILERLRQLEQDTGLKIIIKDSSMETDAKDLGAQRYIITVLGIDRPGIMAGISGLLAARNVNIEHCRMIACGDFFSMQMVVDASKIFVPDKTKDPIAEMKSSLKDICQSLGQSVVIQDEAAHKKMKKLIVFDVESALIDGESTLRMLYGLRDLLRKKGLELDTPSEEGSRMEVLTMNVHKLKGTPISELKNLADNLALNPGGVDLLNILKGMGFKIGLLSSGLEIVLKKLFHGVDVDYAFANTLEITPDGTITGQLEQPVITDESKAQILEFMMNMEHAAPDQVIAVGDGSPRSGFIRNAGLSIAYRPKQSGVVTDGVLETDQISHILYCLGIPMVELKKYMEKDTKKENK